MGRRLQVDPVVARVALATLAIFCVVLLALGAAALAFVARIDADTLRPILDLPEGQAAFRTAMTHAAVALAIAGAALLCVLAPAAYALAIVATRPLREARERERRFSADAAHELRTPLARIASVAQAASGDGDEHDPRDEAFAAIARTALEASSLVGDLLMLSRVETLPESAREPIDLFALARAVAAARTERGTEVALEVRGASGTFVLGDRILLQRLIGNLVDNAVRHARSRVTVDVGTAGGRASVVVDDDGPGVPDELRGRIFERFAIAAGGGGTGLGLALCRWIARAHGGDVRFIEGSRFSATLPEAPA